MEISTGMTNNNTAPTKSEPINLVLAESRESEGMTFSVLLVGDPANSIESTESLHCWNIQKKRQAVDLARHAALGASTILTYPS